MRSFLIAAFAAGAITASAGAASAMPLSSAPGVSGDNVTLVAGGCGLGFHRGPYGGCRANRFMGGPRFRRGPVVVVRPGWRRGGYYRRY